VVIHSGPNGQMGLRLKIRNLWTFEKHPRAASPYYDCSTHVAQPIANVSIAICGFRMVASLEFVDGLTKHLLMDWSTLQAMVLPPIFYCALRTDKTFSGSKNRTSSFSTRTSFLESGKSTTRWPSTSTTSPTCARSLSSVNTSCHLSGLMQ